MSKWTKRSIIIVAYPNQGDGTDPEALGLVIKKVLLNLKSNYINPSLASF